MMGEARNAEQDRRARMAEDTACVTVSARWLPDGCKQSRAHWCPSSPTKRRGRVNGKSERGFPWWQF